MRKIRILYTRNNRSFNNFQGLVKDYLWQNILPEIIHLPLIDSRKISINSREFNYAKEADFIIFTSQSAVNFYPEKLLKNNANSGEFAAIGKITEQALRVKIKAIIQADDDVKIISPKDNFTSEELLKELKINNKRVAIITAKGGRNLLYSELAKNNQCEFIFCYERFNPQENQHIDTEKLQDISAILISSNSALENLERSLPVNLTQLLKSQAVLVAFSERIAETARQNNWQKVLAANQTSELAQLQILDSYFFSLGD